jgi:hypothetical protein
MKFTKCPNYFLKPNLQLTAHLGLQESYRLLYVTAPDVAAYESAIATLNDEIRGHKTRIVEKEAGLAKDNPPIFQAVQVGLLLAPTFSDVSCTSE